MSAIPMYHAQLTWVCPRPRVRVGLLRSLSFGVNAAKVSQTEIAHEAHTKARFKQTFLYDIRCHER
eukprot:5539447-Amphidinium_carterae.1